MTRSLVLALGVCYHARLSNRAEYRKAVARHFVPPAELKGGTDAMEKEIVWLVRSHFSKKIKSHLKYFSWRITVTHKSYFAFPFMETTRTSNAMATLYYCRDLYSDPYSIFPYMTGI